MMLADYTFHFAIDYVMYPAAVAAAGMAFAILVKIVRKFDLSAFPFWIPLMVAGAGAFGFGIADMPDNSGTLPDPPNLIKTNSDADNAKKAEIAKAHYEYLDKHPVQVQQEPRTLPRWADGLMCVGGAGMLLCGLVLMVCRLYEKYGNSTRANTALAGWADVSEQIKCLDGKMNKIMADQQVMFPQASVRWERWDAGHKDHGERLNAIQNKLRELQSADKFEEDNLFQLEQQVKLLRDELASALKSPPGLAELQKLAEANAKQVAELAKAASDLA